MSILDGVANLAGCQQNKDGRLKTEDPKPKTQDLINFKFISTKETVFFALLDAERHKKDEVFVL